jgi:6-phosphogluconate dehydrogenase (decarboxylating)
MHIGIVGLGRMGANIARRLMRHGHVCVVHDRDAEPGRRLAGEGAIAVDSLAALAQALPAPRVVWLMLPAGEITEAAIAELGGLLGSGDTIIDGGNTFWKDDIRRAGELTSKGIHYVDVGTSGGVWGLERGYCLMIGGEAAVMQRLDPIFAALAPGMDGVPVTTTRKGRDARAEQGYLHCGPSGAGHFVKMIHNGIEYGMMQAFAEGFDILKNANRPICRRSTASPSTSPTWPRSGGAAASSPRGCSTSQRGAGRGPAAGWLFGPRCRLRRRPLDRAGGHRGGGAGRGADGGALRPLPFAPGPHLCRESALRHAQRVRRACRDDQAGCRKASVRQIGLNWGLV